ETEADAAGASAERLICTQHGKCAQACHQDADCESYAGCFVQGMDGFLLANGSTFDAGLTCVENRAQCTSRDDCICEYREDGSPCFPRRGDGGRSLEGGPGTSSDAAIKTDAS